MRTPIAQAQPGFYQTKPHKGSPGSTPKAVRNSLSAQNPSDTSNSGFTSRLSFTQPQTDKTTGNGSISQSSLFPSEPEEPSQLEQAFPELIFECLKINICPVTIQHLETIFQTLIEEIQNSSSILASDIAQKIQNKHEYFTMVQDDHCVVHVLQAKYILTNYEKSSILVSNEFYQLDSFNASIKELKIGNKIYNCSALKLLLLIRAWSQIKSPNEKLQTKMESIMRHLAKKWPVDN